MTIVAVASLIIGRLTCVDTKPKQVNISWPNGISENLAFSPDKKSLPGTNTIGVQVSGAKKKSFFPIIPISQQCPAGCGNRQRR